MNELLQRLANRARSIAGRLDKQDPEPEIVASKSQESARQAYSQHIESSLSALADRYGSDKGSDKHHYARLYELLFQSRRNHEFTFVEMGLLIGGPEHDVDPSRATDDLPSVRMWLEYFPNAHIVGADISDFGWFDHQRFTYVQCDMSERANFADLRVAADGAEIIIDDASHASSHQQFGLVELFPGLAPGGIYVIEDLQWQPRAFEAQRPEFPTTSELMRGFVRHGFFTHPDAQLEDELNALVPHFGGVFLQGERFMPDTRDKMVVIHKKALETAPRTEGLTPTAE